MEEKMRKRFTGIIAGLLTLVLLAGCETTKPSADTDKDKAEKKDEKQLVETLRPTLTEAEKINLAESILERMMKGINKEDYSLYSGNFFKGLKDQFPEKGFKEFRNELKKDMGEYKSRMYLGALNKKLVDVFIWKAKFSNSEDDCLIRLTLIEDEGVYKVLGFNISKI
jgi:ABC-type oligopeptide transport system substrate-binding subunit